jgi:hypothetical protein
MTFSPTVGTFAIPVTIDEEAGTFAMDRTNLPQLRFGTQAGSVDIKLAGPITRGSIDAGGNVTVPDFQMAFSPSFVTSEFDITPTLSTGIESPSRGNVTTRGVPLDFVTGSIVLDGAGIIGTAPIISQAVVAELTVTCTLSPLPDRSKLPAPFHLQAVHGTVHVGKAPKPGSTKPDKGDTLTFKARVSGGTNVNLGTQDAFIEIRTGANDAVLLEVAAGTFGQKGKNAVVKDTDGTRIQVLAGAKQSTNQVAAGGKITVTSARKGSTVTAVVQGLDLSTLAGAATATLTVGPNAGTAAITVKGSGKNRTFH